MASDLYELFQSEIDAYGGLRLVNPNIFPVNILLPGATAAVAANFGTAQIIPVAAQLIKVYFHYTTAGGAAAAVQLEKITGTQANGAGTVLLTAAQSLIATANTVYTGSLVATSAVNFAAGDRLGLVDSGTLTGLTDLNILALFKLSSQLS